MSGRVLEGYFKVPGKISGMYVRKSKVRYICIYALIECLDVNISVCLILSYNIIVRCQSQSLGGATTLGAELQSCLGWKFDCF